MIILDHDRIQKLFSMTEAIETAKEIFVMNSKGQTKIPPKTCFSSLIGESFFMPAYVGGNIDQTGLKITSAYPQNANFKKPTINSLIILMDSRTGEVKAQLDATHITRISTASIGALAIDLLAPSQTSIGTIIGTGGLCASHIEAMLTVRKLKEIRLFSKNLNQAQDVAKQMSQFAQQRGAKITATDDVDQATKDADIITTATTSNYPVLKPHMIKKGVHINAMGSHNAFMQEVDEQIYLQANKIFIDNPEAITETGDLITPLQMGLFEENHISGELGDILQGKAVGRTSNEDLTILKSTGCPALDILVAHKILQKHLNQN